MKFVPKTSTYSFILQYLFQFDKFIQILYSYLSTSLQYCEENCQKLATIQKIKKQDKKKNKHVRFSLDVLGGDTINRVALHTKLVPRNSRYLPTYMIRCAHVTRKLYGRSSVDNLGSLHRVAAHCSIIQLWQQKICVSNNSP